MASNFENGFFVREPAWHGLGTIVQEAPTSMEALKVAGLDWTVRQEPMYLENNVIIKNAFANVRSSDNSVLGITTERYKVVQNADAFSFTDALLEQDVRYESAGSLAEGKRIFILARMPEVYKIGGDEVEPYLVFTNSFDGKGSIRVALTPIRVVCQNTLNLALQTAKRQWSTKHMGNMDEKMHEAQRTLELASGYMQGLSEEAERMMMKKVTVDTLDSFLEALFPMDDNMTSRKVNNVIELRNGFRTAYNMPDIADFKGTAWGVINAVSDMVGHMPSQRQTDTFAEKRFMSIMDGHKIMDTAQQILMAV
jgi:phage/plasmid-like protein (TIGR03299 family)